MFGITFFRTCRCLLVTVCLVLAWFVLFSAQMSTAANKSASSIKAEPATHKVRSKPQMTIVFIDSCTMAWGDAVTEKILPDSVRYTVSSAGTLRLEHYNLDFNCCPDSINALLDVIDSLVIITEYDRAEVGQGCKCDCLFNVVYEIKNLRPGVYRFRIDGQYGVTSEPSPVGWLTRFKGQSWRHEENRKPLEFHLVLKPGLSGSFSVPLYHGAFAE